MSRYSLFLLVIWIVLMLSNLNIIQKLDGQIRPVVTNFQIVDAIEYPDGVEIWGTFNKARSCSFVSLKGVLTKSDVSSDIEIDFKDMNKVRTEGYQTYGPWKMDITIKDLENLSFYSVHNCVNFISTITTIEITKNGAL